MRKRFIPVFLLLSFGLWAAPPADRGPDQGCACANLSLSQAPLNLSPSAAAALRFQIDEERMAGEIYRTLGERWTVRPFRNIPRAENRHHAMLLGLAARAGMKLEESTIAGKFATPAVQSRYDALVARGQTSLIEALKVGAFVEEQDIADLQTLAATTDSKDLQAVVAVLEAGSRNHLRAFARNLRARGIDYAPQILSADDCAAIIGATAESGSGGAGRGRGKGCAAPKRLRPGPPCG